MIQTLIILSLAFSLVNLILFLGFVYNVKRDERKVLKEIKQAHAEGKRKLAKQIATPGGICPNCNGHGFLVFDEIRFACGDCGTVGTKY